MSTATMPDTTAKPKQEDNVIQALSEGRAVYYRGQDGELYRLVSTQERERAENEELKKKNPLQRLLWRVGIRSK